jgi:cupin 2 domain-containing protein
MMTETGGIMVTAGNLLSPLPGGATGEHVTELLSSPNVAIERIVSRAHATAPGFWYDQDKAEWVIVLTGSAGLQFEGEAAPRTLRPGDYVHIPAHARHRVEWTDSAQATVWLAVHYS